jgi:hypothetical protein
MGMLKGQMVIHWVSWNVNVNRILRSDAEVQLQVGFHPHFQNNLENRLIYSRQVGFVEYEMNKDLHSSVFSWYRNFLLFWNSEINHHVHKIPPLDPLLSQFIAVQLLTPWFSRIFFLILSFHLILGLLTCVLSSVCQNFGCNSCFSHVCYMFYPPHPFWFNHPYNNMWRVWHASDGWH